LQEKDIDFTLVYQENAAGSVLIEYNDSPKPKEKENCFRMVGDKTGFSIEYTKH